MGYSKKDSFERGSRGRFNDRDSRSRRDSFNDRDSSGFDDRRGRLEMHDATCDKCGKPCQLPFRPSQGKPVYCSDCFRKKESYESRESSVQKDNFSEQLNEINRKLDKIMKMLKVD